MDVALVMLSTPSSSHALISVLRAVSPDPKSAETALSERGSVCGTGRWRTELASAARVKPCCQHIVVFQMVAAISYMSYKRQREFQKAKAGGCTSHFMYSHGLPTSKFIFGPLLDR